ncbi:MAG TPA: cytochrome c-type biogenesis protein [Azospirillaceae bacterium]|nr:cytochrome c-type biogenesis protein [Azospirillaceae bacterium]
MSKRLATAALLAALLSGPALAVQPEEILPDPAMEARAREISKDLRCLVCQNQSIDDSNAGLAKDLRVLVRERLVAGDSNDQVIEFVTARYGDYVLLDPPVKPATYGLWFGPAAVLLVAGAGVAMYLRNRRREADDPRFAAAGLTADETARLRELMRDEAGAPADKGKGA